ncbi:MAG: hypothetical protein NC396_05005 [Bacteroides sp.]|nr:hypothetical protein [Bacteroides sp.]MCM1085717.1 hypothetical protein [Bacteroides sp.]
MKRFLLQFGIFALAMAALLVLLIVTLPSSPTGYTREFFIKQRMMSDEERNPSIILLGGSNVAFGYNSPMIAERLQMPVINVGLNAGVGLKLMVDESFPYLKKGDVLVFSPEYDHFFGLFAYGYLPLAEVFYQGKGECAAKMNLQQWRVVCRNMPMLLQKRVDYKIKSLFIPPEESSKVYQVSSFNEYGDIVVREEQEPLRIPLKKEPPGNINREIIHWLEVKLMEISRKGVSVCMLPPILARTAYANKEVNIERVDSCLRKIGFPFICTPWEMTYPDSLFYDTFYHLDSLGVIIHTEDVIDLLKKRCEL